MAVREAGRGDPEVMRANQLSCRFQTRPKFCMNTCRRQIDVEDGKLIENRLE